MSRASTLFALGCALVLGGVLGSLVRSAHAQRSARKWEQSCSYRQSLGVSPQAVTEGMNEDLRARGAEGSELVTVASVGNYLEYCFKRPAP